MWLVQARHMSVASTTQRLAAIKSSYCPADDPALVTVGLEVKAIWPARVQELLDLTVADIDTTPGPPPGP